MSKKIAIIALLSLSISLSNISFAAVADETSTPVVTSNVSIKDQALKETVNGAEVVNKRLNEPADRDQEMPLPATGWLLFFSLIGFVLLSNRQNI